MKRINLIFLVFLCFAVLISCKEDYDVGGVGDIGGGSACLVGEVTAVNGGIDIIAEETEFTSGPYHILVNDNTKFVFENGQNASISDVKAGNKIEIIFNGQVMLSYPPQIAAQKIVIK